MYLEAVYSTCVYLVQVHIRGGLLDRLTCPVFVDFQRLYISLAGSPYRAILVSKCEDICLVSCVSIEMIQTWETHVLLHKIFVQIACTFCEFSLSFLSLLDIHLILGAHRCLVSFPLSLSFHCAKGANS